MKRTRSPDSVQPEPSKRRRYDEPASEHVSMSQPRAHPRNQEPENQRKTAMDYSIFEVSREQIMYVDEAGDIYEASYPLICGGTLTGVVGVEGISKRKPMLDLRQQDQATLKEFGIQKVGDGYQWSA